MIPVKSNVEGIITALKQAVQARKNVTEPEMYDRMVECMKAIAQEDLNPEHMCSPKNLKDALTRENWEDWFHCKAT